MKLPSSSSLLLATLAISSSSSTLAAPAGEGDAAITTSSSNQRISALLGTSDICDLGSVDIEPRASANIESSDVDSDTPQNSLVYTLLKMLHTLPIIGHPVAALIEKSFPNGTDSAEGMPIISPDDLLALQAAIIEVSRALSQSNQTTLGVSSGVQSVAPTMTNSSVSNGFATTSAAPAGPTNTTSSVSPLSAAADENTTTHVALTPSESVSTPQSSPMSPTIPGNPPNTPVPPAP